MRNLARLRTAGIRAPRPLQLRAHVLVMEFVGAGGVAAPRLKARAGSCRSAASAPMPFAVQALLCAPSTRVRSRGAASGRVAAPGRASLAIVSSCRRRRMCMSCERGVAAMAGPWRAPDQVAETDVACMSRRARARRQDARAPLAQLQVFYTQLVLLVRQLYQECRLVHADLSEYNILVHQARDRF